MVHSGGFYQVEKIKPGPGEVPKTLHWFKWEAAITWISGFFLLGLIYYSTRGLYLVDPLVADISPGMASGIGIGALVLSWVLYDLLWVSPIGKNIPVATLLSLIALVALTYLLCHLMSGRGAYIHIGAVLGTLMVANVWMRILPAQSQMIAATNRGEEADFSLGERAKWRSVHNTYMTFPVLFVMLSSHFPGTYASQWNWVVLILLFVVGGGARFLMVSKGRARPAVFVGVALALIGVVLITWPQTTVYSRQAGESGEPVSFVEVKAVITARCLNCHSDEPRDMTFGAAPAGVSFDRDSEILRFADRIHYRVSVNKTMPLGNTTRMTLEERELLSRWVGQGARPE